MKTIISTIILSVCMLSLQAMHFNSEVSINTPGIQRIMINMGGQSYTSSAGNVILRDVIPGRHRVQITAIEDGYWGPVHKTLYSGHITVPHSSIVFAEVTRGGLLRLETKSLNLGPCGHPLDAHGHCSMGCRPVRPMKHPAANGHHVRPNNAVLVHNGPANTCAPTPVAVGMHPQTFNQVMRTIENQAFSSSKMAVAKQAISSNGISSAQVADMMRLFSFESYKVELAKFAYGYVADPQNYWLVNNGFSFTSSVRELDQYIAGYY